MIMSSVLMRTLHCTLYNVHCTPDKRRTTHMSSKEDESCVSMQGAQPSDTQGVDQHASQCRKRPEEWEQAFELMGSAQRASEVGEGDGAVSACARFAQLPLPECFHAEVESQMTMQVATTSGEQHGG